MPGATSVLGTVVPAQKTFGFSAAGKNLASNGMPSSEERKERRSIYLLQPRTGCSSTPLGATPVCPCRKSKNTIPVIFTFSGVTCLNLAIGFPKSEANCFCNAVNSEAYSMGTHEPDGISAIIVSPVEGSDKTI